MTSRKRKRARSRRRIEEERRKSCRWREKYMKMTQESCLHQMHCFICTLKGSPSDLMHFEIECSLKWEIEMKMKIRCWVIKWKAAMMWERTSAEKLRWGSIDAMIIQSYSRYEIAIWRETRFWDLQDWRLKLKTMNIYNFVNEALISLTWDN